LILLALLACTTPKPDVVLVTLDTVRWDVMAAHGGTVTPHLDRLAARGVRFDQMRTPAPLTIPAHIGMFLGEHPTALGRRTNANGGMPVGESLAESYQAQGYATGAAVGAWVTSSAHGFDRGFDVFHDELQAQGSPWKAERPGSRVVDDFSAWWATAKGPKFGWVHLFDAHAPHPRSETPYLDDVARADAALGRVLDLVGPETIVLVVSDHGEARGDHGETTHGLFAFDATARVPAVLAGPGLTAAVDHEPRSLLDVRQILQHAVRGQLPQPPSATTTDAWTINEHFAGAPRRAVVRGDSKWIDPDGTFAILADPGERTPNTGQSLAGLLPPAPGAESGLDDETLAYLTALGYLGDATPPPEIDPVRAALALDRARSQRAAGDAGAALLTLRAELAGGLSLPLALEVLSLEEALGTPSGVLDRALADYPEHPGLLAAKATRLMKAGEPEAAARAFLSLTQSHPETAVYREGTLIALTRAGRVAEAKLRARVWRESHPEDPALAGFLALHSDPFDVELAQQGLESLRPMRGLQARLGDHAWAAGRRASADKWYAAELELWPDNTQAALRRIAYAGTRQDMAAVLQIATDARAAKDDALLAAAQARAELAMGLVFKASESTRDALALNPNAPDALALRERLQALGAWTPPSP